MTVLLLGLFGIRSYPNLKIQNDTGGEITLAIAYIENGIWYTEGWFTVKPFEILVVYKKPLQGKLYYYAKGNHNVWKGSATLYVEKSQRYKTAQTKFSKEKNIEKLKFKRIRFGSKSEATLVLYIKESNRRLSSINAVLCPRF